MKTLKELRNHELFKDDREELDEIEDRLEIVAFMIGLLSGLRKCGVISDEDVNVILGEDDAAKKHLKGFLKAALLMEECEDDEDEGKIREVLDLLQGSVNGLAGMVGPAALESGAFQQFTAQFDALKKDLG